ncbi:hypothetical protein [Promicromonospora kroppenstedtii]|uniref:hypothetical protein n=1 Tax=Promicromonospora kroppenstedtii TaxID=440482 RepID=UPI00146F96E8|nr:hypothetical protein [Promicromonospora kroppenstedtii]
MEPSLAPLQRQAVEHMRRYLAAPVEERTPHVRAFAEVLFEARQHFLRGDGEPDYAGRTHPYRRWVGEVYAEAGVPAERRNSIRSSVSWHLSEIMRESVDKETLADHGAEASDAVRGEPGAPQARPRRRARPHVPRRRRRLADGDHRGSDRASEGHGAELTRLDPHAAEVAKATLEDLESTARRLSKRVAVRPVAEEGGAPLFSATD